MRVSNLMVLIAIPVIAGLDVGRFRWSGLDTYFAVVGLVLLFISMILLNWAMVVNPFFEPTVRIQKDRGQSHNNWTVQDCKASWLCRRNPFHLINSINNRVCFHIYPSWNLLSSYDNSNIVGRQNASKRIRGIFGIYQTG